MSKSREVRFLESEVKYFNSRITYYKHWGSSYMIGYYKYQKKQARRKLLRLRGGK